MTPVMLICSELMVELDRARSKHPIPFNSSHEGYAIILEELEEAWEEIKKQERSNAKVRKELIQVGAMVIRFIQDVIERVPTVAVEFPFPLRKAPSDAAEYESITFYPFSLGGGKRCSEHWHNWNCTRLHDHPGDHVAGGYDVIMARWPR